MNYGKTAIGFIACMLLTVLFTGCSGSAANSVKEAAETPEPTGKAYFTYFDTVSYVYNYAGDSAEAFDERSAGASAVLAEYHRLFDIYHEYSEMNNLCTVNRLAGGEPVAVDEKLIDFLLLARDLYEQTNGEMNVMMGAVLRIWHEHRTDATEDPAKASVPPLEALEAAAAHIAFDLLEIDEENHTVRITDPEASIDVGALGKGYATEKAAEYLEADGAYGYVLNVGGNIRIIGTKPNGEGWVTGVRDPGDPDNRFITRLNLADTACVTSGTYERFYAVDGVRYHHIIDKDTLFPAAYFSSITVVTKDSGLADALSTALFCMSYEEGAELLSRLEGVEALWVLPDGQTRVTDGLKNCIVEQNT